MRSAQTSRRITLALSAAAVVALGASSLIALDRSTAYAASTATINGSSVLQPIDGFGFSEAFGRTNVIRAMSTQNQQQVLDLLFSPTTGAGMNILRLGISSTGSSIQPTNPGGPNATPRYVWDGNDDGQVWLSKQAQSYGVSRFYANPWSAPGYMKTNGDEANGGALCGLSGASCASGDWRRAYANYLIQYTRFYAQEGIRITDLAFTNEPNWTATYSSMRFTPAQAAELAKIVGPLADAEGMNMMCCDAINWTSEATYSSAIMADSEASRWVDIHTGHSYGNGPSAPLSVGGRHTWTAEWSPDGTTWNENWDDGSGYDGFTVAQAIHTAMTGGNVNGYVYWYGVSTGATRGFIQANGANYRASKRLWAMAGYSRFIRPGANRIGASTSDGNLRLSAYRNSDGSIVVVALNVASSATSVSYSLQNTGVTTGSATPYVTNSSSSMAAQPAVGVSGGAFTATVPARSLATYVIRGGGGPTPSPSTSPSPSASPSPPGGSCTATLRDGTRWPDRFNTEVTVSGATNWTVVIALTPPQQFSSAWNASSSVSRNLVTLRSNGSGNVFGVTTLANGNFTRPQVRSCTAT